MRPADVPREAHADTELLVEAVRSVAHLALRSFRRDPRVWLKVGNSPVSEADLAVDRSLKSILSDARPSYGWLSEETSDSPERLSRRRVFVIDPIDGTWAYITGRKDWAISAAVVEDERPLAAALFAPAQGHLYSATRNGGAQLDGRTLTLSGTNKPDALRVAGPRKLVRRVRGSLTIDPASTVYVSSLALRIASVAAGRFDLALAGGNSHDWDLAAADLILQEAGGLLTSLAGDRPIYNRREPVHPPLVAAAEPLHGSALAAFGEARKDDRLPIDQ